MKRKGNLYAKICSLENLYLADQKAQRGKSGQPGVIAHNDNWAHTWGHQKNGGAHSGPILSWHDTAAQARAGMLIYLLENGSLSPGQVNERLMDKNS